MKTILLAFIVLLFTGVHSQNIYTIAGNGSMGYSGDGGPATAADLYDPEALAADGIGNIYVTDFDNVLVRKISTTGIITTIAGIPNNYPGGFSGDGGPATAAEIAFPWGVGADAAGNVYIADCGNERIRKVNTAGIINTVAGNGWFLGGFSGDGGPATAAELNSPNGVAIDLAGNIYIAEQGNNRIRKVNTLGIIITVAGNGYGSGGNGGYSGDGGAATAAELYTPWGVAVDPIGNIYIADEGNHVVRKVNTNGVITTFAGNGTLSYSGDGGPATAAEMGDPYKVALDGAGNLFIADWYMNVIRKVNTNGIISTFAGTGAWSFGGDGGPATAAYLENPSGITVDCSGNIYIADNSNQRVREVPLGGSPCQLLADFSASDTTVCVGDSIYFTDMSTNSPTNWQWTFNGGNPPTSSRQNPVVYYGSAGTYTVKEVIKKGASTDSLTRFLYINVVAAPIASVHSNKDTICTGDSATLIASGGSTYLWKPGGQTTSFITVKPTITTRYTVVVSNGGCSDSSAIAIVAPCTSMPCATIFVPTGFSPNNDGENDILYVRSGCISQMDFIIYDRWGNKVFESENLNNGWDGTYNGKPMETGTYMYYLKALMTDGSLVSRKGSVTLVR